MDAEALGIAFVIACGVVASVVALWPRRDIAALQQLEADEMSATRELLQTSAVRVADDEQMPDSMMPALLDFADSLVPSVHAGTVAIASAITKITNRAQFFKRSLS